MKVKTSTIVLIVVCVMLIAFTVANLIIFNHIGSCPDTLIVSVFSAGLGELGILGWIRNTKSKYGDDSEIEEE